MSKNVKLTLKIELVVGHDTSEQRLSQKMRKAHPGRNLSLKKSFFFFLFFSRHFLNAEAQPPASDTTSPEKIKPAWKRCNRSVHHLRSLLS